MRSIATLISTGTLLMLVSTFGAEAGRLNPEGTVMINRGNGFEVVDAPVDCHPTDRVMVDRGSAHIEYRDGTRLGLIPGHLYVVGTTGRRDDDERAGAYGHGPHGGAPVAQAGATGFGGLSTSALVIGGVVAAGGAALIISKVASPSSP